MVLNECMCKGEEDVEEWDFRMFSRDVVCADRGSAFRVKVKAVFIALVTS